MHLFACPFCPQPAQVNPAPAVDFDEENATYILGTPTEECTGRDRNRVCTPMEPPRVAQDVEGVSRAVQEGAAQPPLLSTRF